MQKTSKIYIAGHNGMVGSAIVRKLQSEGYVNLILRDSKELDLRNQTAVSDFFSVETPEYVFLAAARVGGIHANNVYRAEFLYDNLMIQNNIIHQSYVHGVKKLLFLGSSCIYPKNAPQPMKEEHLLTGLLEQTNEPYAIAKIAGIKMVENYAKQYNCNFTAVMPTNLYGPNDNFSKTDSHVIPGLISRMHNEASMKSNTFNIWGTGKPLREFLYSDDLADAIKFVLENNVKDPLINIGSGEEISIKEVAFIIKDVIGFQGELVFDTSKPDGNPRKLLDSNLINSYGWSPKTKIDRGINNTYEWFVNNIK